MAENTNAPSMDVDEASNENDIGAYEVVPLTTCPHLDTVKDFAMFGFGVNQECPECESEEDKMKKENWICLTCHAVNCSRYVRNHAMEHFNLNPDHCMALSTVDLSVWCYACEHYVHNEKLLHAKNELHMIKFDVPTPDFQ